MPVQQINVKNSADIESFEWAMSAGAGGGPAGAMQARAGSGSSHTSYSNSSGDICRICHCESDAHNPLLAPCYCSGSLKFVHQSCLQQWLTASETRSCELCKFNFIMHTKIKPFNEWRLLEMSGVERRRLCCAVLFHCVAALCVMWSLFVLIERAVEEVNRGIIAWPFWTKLAVVAVGFTGGAVFMYIQCRQYLHLCNRWRAHNRILLIQNAPDKLNVTPPSPVVHHIPMHSVRYKRERERSSQGQVVANIENDPHNSSNAQPATSPRNLQQLHVEHHAREEPPSCQDTQEEDESGGFETYTFNPYRRVSSLNEHKPHTARTPDAHAHKYTDLPENRRFSDTRLVQGFNPAHVPPPPPFNTSQTVHHIANEIAHRAPRYSPAPPPLFASPPDKVYHISDLEVGSAGEGPSLERPQVSDIEFELVPRAIDPLEFNIREMLELDARSEQRRNRSVLSLNREQPPAGRKPSPPPTDRAVFKSLPNLSASCENLLPPASGS